MSKHTWGPWEAEKATRGGYWISARKHPFTVVDSTDEEGRYGAIAGDNAEANAHLIAAAPELLDVARMALLFARGEAMPTGAQLEAAALSAIAKAEGKQ